MMRDTCEHGECVSPRSHRRWSCILLAAGMLVCAPCPSAAFGVWAPARPGIIAQRRAVAHQFNVRRDSADGRSRRHDRLGAVGIMASSGVLPDKAGDIGMQELEDFRKLLRESVGSKTFVKATLSQNKGDEKTLTNVYMRLVELKSGVNLQVKLRHKTNDVTKNFPVAEVPAKQAAASTDAVVRDLLLGGFRQAYLFTSTGDWQLKLGKKPWLQRVGKGPTFDTATVEAHDRVKAVPVKKDAQYLQLLGITNEDGQPRPGKSDKLRQIQQFVSVVNRAVTDSGLAKDVQSEGGRALKVVDMGCGKGYLTFAAHCHLSDSCGLRVRTQGVELRQELVDNTNSWCEELGIAPAGDAQGEDEEETGLSFVQGFISETLAHIPGTAGGTDVLVALHACDTATDEAIRAGISASARVIIVAPCCHKELRGQLDAAGGQKDGGVLQDIVSHGILAGRMAEMATDAIRALLLEMVGYRTQVFEFIDGTHTTKNIMITAIKRSDPSPQASPEAQAMRNRLAQLFKFYGIGVQRLAMLLGENPVSENGRFVHQMATLKHANDQRADLIKGSSSDIHSSSSDIKGSSSDIKGSSSTVTPLGKRIRTNGESVDLSLNLPLDSAE